MNTLIDEDLMKREYMRKTLMYITDDITIDQYDTEFCVSVWSEGACVWVTYEIFNSLDEAIKFASNPENVK